MLRLVYFLLDFPFFFYISNCIDITLSFLCHILLFLVDMPPFFCLLLSSCGCTSVCNFSEIWGIHFQNYFLYCLYFYFNLARYGIQIYKPWCSLFKNLIFALTCLADPSMAPELNTDVHRIPSSATYALTLGLACMGLSSFSSQPFGWTYAFFPPL